MSRRQSEFPLSAGRSRCGSLGIQGTPGHSDFRPSQSCLHYRLLCGFCHSESVRRWLLLSQSCRPAFRPRTGHQGRWTRHRTPWVPWSFRRGSGGQCPSCSDNSAYAGLHLFWLLFAFLCRWFYLHPQDMRPGGCLCRCKARRLNIEMWQTQSSWPWFLKGSGQRPLRFQDFS